MSTIRAVVLSPEVEGRLAIKEVPVPVPLPNEALVRVSAVSLNRGEVRTAMTSDSVARPGWDLAGTVVQAAADGSRPPLGARVVGLVRSGAWAEQVAVPTVQLAALPDGVTFAQAATLPVAGLTAMHALWKGGFLLERPVLVTGATGGVGDYALQLARLIGAKVVASVRRPEQVASAQESGAQHVAVGDDLSQAQQYGPYALILESIGGRILTDAMTMLAEKGTLVQFGASSGASVTFDAMKFYRIGQASLYGLFLFEELRNVESAALGLTRLAGLIDQGKLKPRIAVEESWEKVAEVAKQLIDRSYPGKAVLHIGE
jgi:NADPH2:quinone reductase